MVKSILITLGYAFIVVLYLVNDRSDTPGEIMLDAFMLTGGSLVVLVFLYKSIGSVLRESYFQIRRFEYRSSLYTIIGVPLFKKVLAHAPIPSLTRRIALTGFAGSDLRTLEGQLREAEEIHVLGAGITLLLALLFGLVRSEAYLVWFMVFNLIINVYPALVQRYNRNRIRRIIEKKNQRRENRDDDRKDN